MLSLIFPEKVEILKYVFKHPQAKGSLQKTVADVLLTELIVAVSTILPLVLALMNDNVDQEANELESSVGHYM